MELPVILNSFSYSIKIIISFLLFLVYLHTNTITEARQVTQFEGFCNEKKLYKPYVKYYKDRARARHFGKPFKTHKPSLITDFEHHPKNTYVCINGLAWLYFKLDNGVRTIYNKPELHQFVHHCFVLNSAGPLTGNPDPANDNLHPAFPNRRVSNYKKINNFL